LRERTEVFEVRKASGFRVRAGQTDYRYIISLRPVFISVKFNTSAFHFLTFALAGLLVMGCDSTGSSPEDPPPDEGGAVSFSLVRTANSDVPSDADSAFVRVWRPDGDFNLVEFVNIPDPGQQTEVSLDVPANQGYRAGILAVKPGPQIPSDRREIQAHGSSGRFTVQASDTSQVDLDVRPLEVTIERPESLTPNRTDTIKVVYQLNPPSFGAPRFFAEQSSNPMFSYDEGEDLNEIGRPIETDTSFTSSFEITGPNVSTEDTTYVKALTIPDNDAEDVWTTPSLELSPNFFPSEGGSSFEIPVVPEGDGDGTVIITFSRDGDGWEKTRRVVE
jgi:hypothetical protein